MKIENILKSIKRDAEKLAPGKAVVYYNPVLKLFSNIQREDYNKITYDRATGAIEKIDNEQVLLKSEKVLVVKETAKFVGNDYEIIELNRSEIGNKKGMFI